MLGISFGEILIIGTIGLLVIGPKRLPETARFIGHLFNRIQRQVNSLKADIRREMVAEDMKKMQNEYEDATRDMRNIFDQAAAGVSPPANPGSLGAAPAADAPATPAPVPPPAVDTAATETPAAKTDEKSGA